MADPYNDNSWLNLSGGIVNDTLSEFTSQNTGKNKVKFVQIVPFDTPQV